MSRTGRTTGPPAAEVKYGVLTRAQTFLSKRALDTYSRARTTQNRDGDAALVRGATGGLRRLGARMRQPDRRTHRPGSRCDPVRRGRLHGHEGEVRQHESGPTVPPTARGNPPAHY